MISGHVFIATSLDGFVARSDHQIDWLTKQPDGDDDGGYAAFEESVDAIVMGSGSFRTVLGFGQWHYQKPVYVMSSSIVDSDIPESLKDKVQITRESPADLMAKLDEQGMNRVYVDGGAVVQSFARQRLISDFTITLVPILIGSGIRLFGELDQDVDLELVETRELSNGMLQVHYRIVNGS